MASYFSVYPSAIYSSRFATDILIRTKIKDSWLADPRLYYQYRYKDGDKPEHLAQKYYGEEDLHWIILFTNNIFDPWFELPMDESTFTKYLEDKYKDSGALVGKTGLEYAQSTPDPVYRYQKIITITNSEGKTRNSYVIDKKSYNNLVALEKYYTGTTYTTLISTEIGSNIITVYDSTQITAGDIIRSNEYIPIDTSIVRKISGDQYSISKPASKSSTQELTYITAITGDSVVYQVERRHPQMTIYERAFEVNEAKRNIRILNKTYVPQAKSEFRKLLAQY